LKKFRRIYKLKNKEYRKAHPKRKPKTRYLNLAKMSLDQQLAALEKASS